MKNSMENNQEHDIIEEDFRDELLNELNELRETNILCDTTIRAQGQDLPAHKCVLSAASPYFRAMFTNELKEKESNLVELQNMKSTTISDVLQFVYTGKASIDSSNAQDLVMIADYLIIPSLKTKASLFLEGTVNASNCLALESFASQYNCESLKQVSVAYEIENFQGVSRSEDFRALDSEKVKELICQDKIHVSEEEQVYEAVISWVKHDLPSRECLLPELLKCLRLFSMSKNSLRKLLEEELISKNLSCTRVIINALDFFLFPDRFEDISPRPRLSLQEYEHAVVLTGGEFPDGSKKDTQCFVPSTRTWVSLPMMPLPRTHHGAAVCGGLLYILGGKNAAQMYCFDPEHNKWSTHGIKLNLKDCSVTCLDKELYVIGGENDVQTCSDVQMYNPVLGKWRQVTPMETCRAGHSAVVLQDQIYVIGGHDGKVCLNIVECYNPLTDNWRKMSDMSKVRRFAAAANVCEKIIVIGGFGDMTNKTIEPTCEILKPNTNQWNLVSSPGVPRAACSAVSINDNVYLFGGENETNILHSVECFDVKSNKWQIISTMPSCSSFVQSSLLKLPKRLICDYSDNTV